MNIAAPRWNLAGSFLLSIPLFFLLNRFLTLTQGKLLLIAAILVFLCILISNDQLSHILVRESGEDDKGLATRKQPKLTRPGSMIRFPAAAEEAADINSKIFYRKTGSKPI